MTPRDASLSPEASIWEQGVARAMGKPSKLGVAFSGGVDSAVLLALAVRSLGPDRAIGILAVSPSLASFERANAHDVAEAIGVDLVEIATSEVDDPRYRANGVDRCFWCKENLFTTISDKVAEMYSLDAIAYGENADDALRPDRPGSLSATNHHVLRPLATAGLGKDHVRRIARELGLSVADKPAAPCLASRIPHGQEVTQDKLAQIEQAESALRDLGFTDARVRHHGDIARIELPDDELVRSTSPELRTALVSGVRRAGFRYVAVDLNGLQSGMFTLTELHNDHG